MVMNAFFSFEGRWYKNGVPGYGSRWSSCGTDREPFMGVDHAVATQQVIRPPDPGKAGCLCSQPLHFFKHAQHSYSTLWNVMARSDPC